MCIPHLFFHLSDDEQSCFCLLAIVNYTAMNTGIQISVQVPAFDSFGYLPRSLITGSYGNILFSFSEN